MTSGGERHRAPVFLRDDLVPGQRVPGPAIIAEKNATTVVEPGWEAEVTAMDHLVLRRVTPREARYAAGTHADPVMLEVFNNLFMSIAEQMGVRLAQTAYSPTRRTCPCTWVPWASRSRPSSRRTPGR
jgi:5-oxoprolinase (ATP-hydrolysing)